ncbi:hypothetical protein FA95DRAFT_1610585 [Auriscalpium vulgare]|uniref:Uncharacterized protein n=1 Tax=Auriscalpium vulgare TaxID=40419 RepID=A0ACB8RDL1_9AGAM|nr:hypothetical protein FA95DRAFT_1610585 [Auriscalpium vulgare]
MTTPVPPIIPIPPNIATLTAPMLFGVYFNACLYGILGSQVYSYNYNFPDDKKRFKILVYGVFIIETAQTAMSLADIYYWYAAGFGNLARLQDTYISPLDGPFICSVIALIVQSFYAYRIWILKPSLLWLSGVVVLISVAQAIGGMIDGIVGHRIRFAQVHSPLTVPATYFWLLGEAVADLLIAGTMVWLLSTSRGSYSNRLLSKIMRLCIETNVLSATVAVIAFILYVAKPNTTYIITPTAILGKLYSNTLMVSLNSRVMLRDAQAAQGTRVYVQSEMTVHPPRADPFRQSLSSSEPEPYKMHSLGSAERGDGMELRAMNSSSVEVRSDGQPGLVLDLVDGRTLDIVVPVLID